MIQAATQNSDRKATPMLDLDFHRNVSSLGRRVLLSIGRQLMFAMEALRAFVEEQSEYAGSTFLAEYRGKAGDEFKTLFETRLYEHGRYCDITDTSGVSLRNYRRMLLNSCLVDGDVGTVYLEIEGEAYLQIIPGHRIGSRTTEEWVQGGRFDGARIIDGVIVNDYWRPIGYRVLKGNNFDYGSYVDIPTQNMLLHYLPYLPGQLRGLSPLGLLGWSAVDREERRRFEALAQKAGAGRVFQIFTESGEPAPGDESITAPGSGDTTAGHPSGMYFEEIDGGMNTYFTSTDPNQRMEAVTFDRPSSNQQEFDRQAVREMLAGAGGSYDFTIDPTKITGHSGRVLLVKLNRKLGELQDRALEPACRRFDLFRGGVWIKHKKIPLVPDWYRLEFQGPAHWSGDRKYDLEADKEEVRSGFSTRAKMCRRRGEDEDDVDAISVKDLKSFYKNVKEIAAFTKEQFGEERPVEEIITMLRPPTPNGLAAPKPDSQGDPQKDNTSHE